MEKCHFQGQVEVPTGWRRRKKWNWFFNPFFIFLVCLPQLLMYSPKLFPPSVHLAGRIKKEKSNSLHYIIFFVDFWFFLWLSLQQLFFSFDNNKTHPLQRLRPCPMVLKDHVECTLQQVKKLQWVCWMRVWKRERMN